MEVTAPSTSTRLVSRRDNETVPRLMGRTRGMRLVRAIRRVGGVETIRDDSALFELPRLAKFEPSLG